MFPVPPSTPANGAPSAHSTGKNTARALARDSMFLFRRNLVCSAFDCYHLACLGSLGSRASDVRLDFEEHVVHIRFDGS